MPESSTESKLSEIDTKQRHPFLLFYVSALVFAAVLVFGDRVRPFWREGIRLLTVLIEALVSGISIGYSLSQTSVSGMLTAELCDLAS